MNDLFDNNKRKVISELLEVVNKGIELLATEHLDKSLYDSFERYVVSTLKIADSTFATNYASYFSSNVNTSFGFNNCGLGTTFNPYLNMSYPNSTASLNRMHKMEQETKEYKIKLKYTLQQLVIIIKGIMYV